VTTYLNKTTLLLSTQFLPSAIAHIAFAWFAIAHCWLALRRRHVRAIPNSKPNLGLPLQAGVGISFLEYLNFILRFTRHFFNQHAQIILKFGLTCEAI
jgi:hypothetical protein